jgi:hypothetical protein
MNEEEDSTPPSSVGTTRESETTDSEDLGKSSFPASDPSAVWIWEVPKVVETAPPSQPRREAK